jgi:nicotinate-nucleotide adenylyltransferase
MSDSGAQPCSAHRIGFFGGSFDPPHLGHLAVARAAQAALGLETVLFAPVGAQPLKPSGSSASFQDRLAMTALAIADDPGFVLSPVDAPKPSGAPNYTLETLLALRAELPSGYELFFLMGADAFFGLRRWHRAAEIPFAASLIVASRPGESLEVLEAALPAGLAIQLLPEPYGHSKFSTESTSPTRPESSPALRSYLLHNSAGESAPFYLLPDLEVEISASQIRAELSAESRNRPISLLPEAVSAYIRAHGLYR